MTREYTFFITDAFTDRSFVGNPSGIVLTKGDMSDNEMQKAARELNHPETICIRKLDRDIYSARYFTPTEEIKISGHAALATFWTLAKFGYIGSSESKKKVLQYTGAGPLCVYLSFRGGEVDFVDVQLPEMKVTSAVEDLEALAEAFEVDADHIGTGDVNLIPAVVDGGVETMIIPLKKAADLYEVYPKRRNLAMLSEKYHCKSFHLFYYDEEKKIVEQRNFSPSVSVWEEAGSGTGSGCTYFYMKENGILSENRLRARQGQEVGRPSEIEVSEKDGHIFVGGTARIVMEGILRL